MPATCPRCRKTLSEAPASAAFCMFCGARLTTVSNGRATDETADLVTRSHLPIPDGLSDADSDPSANDGTPPQSVGDYALLRILGAGGQGSVYEAEHSQSGHRVAVKLLSSKFTGSPISIERFRQEGRLASQIAHPRCVFVYGTDTDAGVPYIVMELMPGTTLKDLVDRRGPLPVGEAIARILDVIDGLIEAHRLGVIHRDVKPSNCFITTDDRVKVGDFGLSKSLVGSNPGKQLTTSGKFVGTVLFAPPEQIRGEEVGYDSDVYSVAATLYFLLTGEAPHQHESLTAALAKVISEPPPPVRSHRPDVPKELDQIVLRGLERDRGRRWQSLEELRDALIDLLPSQQTPARPRMMIGAYLLDSTLFFLVVQLPLQILISSYDPEDAALFEMRLLLDAPVWVLSILYFALFEGILGWSPGKWLFRLRVVKQGQSGPPGVSAAALRATVFHVLWIAAMYLPFSIFSWARPLGPAAQFVALIFGVGLSLAAFVVLANQFRSRWNFRGLHDMASGCRVIQRRPRDVRRRLVSTKPNPFDHPPGPKSALPESVGPFMVSGRVGDLPDGSIVLAAEDRSLSRRIVLWLRPTESNIPPPPDVVRPTRLRQVGDGCLEWNDRTYEWTGYVAPAGAPLGDVVAPDRSLSWTDTRPLLEQIAEELKTAQADGTLPARLGLDQIWVEPAGRMHLLDFPLPNRDDGGAMKSHELIQQTAVLALEGTLRRGAQSVRAPLPRHAASFLDRLLTRTEQNLDYAAIQRDLQDNRSVPSRVTAGMRATHLGIQALFLTLPHLLPLVLFYLLSLTWSSTLFLIERLDFYDQIEVILQDPVAVAKLARRESVREALNDRNREQTLRAAQSRIAAMRREVEDHRKNRLTGLERSIVNRLSELFSFRDAVTVNSEFTATWISSTHQAVAARRTSGELTDEQLDALAVRIEREIDRSVVNGFYVMGSGLLAYFFLNRLVSAFIFGGGVSWLLGGLTLVRSNGEPCGRFRWMLRAAVVWLPVALVCLLLLWVQYTWPNWVVVRVGLSCLLMGLLVAYVALAIRNPSRPPQDRLLGTWLVPR